MKITRGTTLIKRVVYTLLVLTLIYVARNVGYLVFEFILRAHTYTEHKCTDQVNSEIPDYIHQIYYPIKDQNPSARNQKKIGTWKYFHPSFRYVLWNESAVINLIRKDHPELLPVYNSYGHWVQRIDVAKYVILYHYGGWYIDLDISCKQSIKDNLAKDMIKKNKSVVLHAEDTIGPATDFFGITPNHPFIKFVLNGLPNSNKWFLFQHTTIMFSTGPSFLWGRYLNYPCQDEVLILSLDQFSKYARLSHDNSWWGQDTRVIYYTLDHKSKMLTIFVFVCLILVVLCKSKSFISNCIKHTYSRYSQRVHTL